MKRRALLAAAAFAVCRDLGPHLAVFCRDLERLGPEHFVPYPDRHLYTDGWLICPVLLRWQQPPAFLHLERNRRLCPDTFRILDASPRIQVGSFSRLMPGCRVRRHEDRPAAGVLRYHLCLRSDGDAELMLEDTTLTLRPGRGLVFDPSLPHAAENRGVQPRDALIVDFRVDDAEAKALCARRGAVNLGPTADPVGAPSDAGS